MFQKNIMLFNVQYTSLFIIAMLKLSILLTTLTMPQYSYHFYRLQNLTRYVLSGMLNPTHALTHIISKVSLFSS